MAPEALEDYNYALTIMPNYDLALLSRGLLYYSALDYDKALKDFNAYIKKKPADGKGYFYRARIYQAQNNTAAACDDYNKSINYKFLNPKEKPAGLCP